MRTIVPATPLEIALLFYGKRFRGIYDLKAYDRRREYLVLRYARGLSFKECAANERVSAQMARVLVTSGLRILRMPWRRDIWKMLAQERPDILESSLAKDVFREEQ